MSGMRQRIEGNAFVLRRWAYKNTSLILILFTEQYGYFRAVAKGALRTDKYGNLKKALELFRHYHCYWQTGAQLHTLFNYEQLAPASNNHPHTMVLLAYSNELIIAYLPPEIATAPLYTAYQQLYTATLHIPNVSFTQLLIRFNALLDALLSLISNAPTWQTESDAFSYTQNKTMQIGAAPSHTKQKDLQEHLQESAPSRNRLNCLSTQNKRYTRLIQVLQVIAPRKKPLRHAAMFETLLHRQLAGY